MMIEEKRDIVKTEATESVNLGGSKGDKMAIIF